MARFLQIMGGDELIATAESDIDTLIVQVADLETHAESVNNYIQNSPYTVHSGAAETTKIIDQPIHVVPNSPIPDVYASGVVWYITLFADSTMRNKEQYTVKALHNGTWNLDPTKVVHSVDSGLFFSGDQISGLAFDVTIENTGTNAVIRLTITAAEPFIMNYTKQLLRNDPGVVWSLT